MPLISAIVPLYNGERTIRETIESVLNQTFSDFELIIINDGSQDSSLDIVSDISDRRLKVLSYTNAGVNASRNRGICQSSGDFVAFLDADDLWTPDKLASQLKALQENPQASVAYSWTDYIDESSHFLRRGTYLTFNGNVYENLLMINFLENGSNPLIRRQALIEVGGFEESLTYAEDWDMWLRLAAKYDFIGVPSPQILYRVSAHSTSAHLPKLEAGCLQVIERACAQAPPSLQHLKQYSIANLYKYLTHRALEGNPSQQKGLEAIRFLWQAVKNDPSGIRMQVICKVLLKIVAMILLPPEQYQLLLTKFSKLYNTSTILGYLRTSLPIT